MTHETDQRDDAAEDDRVQIDWLRAIAGALAAVASAFLLSTLGAAGTIIGAAIGSIIVTVSSALFTQGLSRSKRSLTHTQATARQKVGLAQAEVLRAGRADDTEAQQSHLEHADEQLAEANQELDDAVAAAAPVSWRSRLAGLPWKRISYTAIALFLAAVLIITIFELIAGRSVSSMTGGSGNEGTTIGHVRAPSGSGSDDNPKEPDPTPSESSEPSRVERAESVHADRDADRVGHSVRIPGADPERHHLADCQPERRRGAGRLTRLSGERCASSP